MRKDENATLFYGHTRGNPVSQWPLRSLVALACSWTFLKICAVPTKLHWDLREEYKHWDNTTDNETLASCQLCFDKAVADKFPQGIYIEMTTCYRKFADQVNVTKPKNAASGNSVESWKTSFDQYGDDWWTQYPLDRSPTKFDTRVFFPKWDHQSMLYPELYWADWVVAFMLFFIALFFIALVLLKMTAPRTSVILSSVVYMVFSPYFTHRLAQTFSWEADSDNCMRVFYENSQFTSSHFYMMCCWYAAMVMMVAPVAAKLHNAGGRAEDEAEGIVALLVLAVAATFSFVMSLANIDTLRQDAPASRTKVFTEYETYLILAVVDCVLVVAIMTFFYRCLEVKEVRKDQVVPIFEEGVGAF
eukprot:TRINITY_DN24038_c0_g1_i1.p1 TRINITY_DN24038_c0_g1~~TRINITY_DN24038_c0_g1_i1.p1  ORF type:complete len:360 (-),score=72.10 TRINITY_DN24038_c0_g1_i1:270-1349(-)